MENNNNMEKMKIILNLEPLAMGSVLFVGSMEGGVNSEVTHFSSQAV